MSISITINQAATPGDLDATVEPDQPGQPGQPSQPALIHQPIDAGGPPAWLLTAVAEAGGHAESPDAVPPAGATAQDAGPAPV